MKYFGIFICGVISFISSSAQSPFSYNSTDGLTSVEPWVYYYADSASTLNFRQISNLPETAFQLNTQKHINFGNTENTIWLRIDLENPSGEELYLIQQLHDVRLLDVYLLRTDGSVRPMLFSGPITITRSLYSNRSLISVLILTFLPSLRFSSLSYFLIRICG